MWKVLVVDDDVDLRCGLVQILKSGGYQVFTAGEAKSALEIVKKEVPHLVLLDMRLPDMNGLAVLEKIKKIDPGIAVIMITAFGETKEIVQAMRLGAFDYIEKPFDPQEMVLNVKNALTFEYTSKDVNQIVSKSIKENCVEEVIGESFKIKHALRQVEIIAPTNMTVILKGESGTGKECIANLIHQKSQRRKYPFIAIDCGAIPESLAESELFGYERGAFTGAEKRRAGKFEQAHEGTLFLDEITNLSTGLQMKLLRILEGHRLTRLGGRENIPIDVRIIVASNVDLLEAIRKGQFRQDIYHRLNEFYITLPSLRERKEDIPILAHYFLRKAESELNKKIEGFSPPAMKSLLNYDWPGNVRELKNIVKKAAVLCNSNLIGLECLVFDENGSIQGVDFNKDLGNGSSLMEISKKAAMQIERQIILKTLTNVGGNKAKAAKILKIDRMTLYSKLKEFHVEDMKGESKLLNKTEL